MHTARPVARQRTRNCPGRSACRYWIDGSWNSNSTVDGRRHGCTLEHPARQRLGTPTCPCSSSTTLRHLQPRRRVDLEIADELDAAINHSRTHDRQRCFATSVNHVSRHDRAFSAPKRLYKLTGASRCRRWRTARVGVMRTVSPSTVAVPSTMSGQSEQRPAATATTRRGGTPPRRDAASCRVGTRVSPSPKCGVIVMSSGRCIVGDSQQVGEAHLRAHDFAYFRKFDLDRHLPRPSRELTRCVITRIRVASAAFRRVAPLRRDAPSHRVCTLGTPCRKSAWNRPPNTMRSPEAGRRSRACERSCEPIACTRNGRVAPNVTIATTVSSSQLSSRSRSLARCLGCLGSTRARIRRTSRGSALERALRVGQNRMVRLLQRTARDRAGLFDRSARSARPCLAASRRGRRGVRRRCRRSSANRAPGRPTSHREGRGVRTRHLGRWRARPRFAGYRANP